MASGGGVGAFNAECLPWGELHGRPVHLYTITGPSGAVLRMTDFGAKVVELHVADRDGRLGDVVLGFDNLEQYVAPNQSMGATIGRYANRIGGGRFVIDGVTYSLSVNEGPNLLHGGGEFENVVWDAEFVTTEWGSGIRFHYYSPDGTHGFPGNLVTNVTYVLTADNALRVIFEAETDKATHVNLTHHGYFNLNGASDTIHDHIAEIRARRCRVKDGVMATAETELTAGKPWDLNRPVRLGDNMERIPLGGYDHDYLIDKPQGGLGLVATVSDPASGRVLRVSSTQPDVIFYAAMGLGTEMLGKYGIRYGPHMGFCIETQHAVDAPNQPQFASSLLRPGDRYRETAVYAFDVDSAT